MRFVQIGEQQKTLYIVEGSALYIVEGSASYSPLHNFNTFPATQQKYTQNKTQYLQKK